MAEILVRVTDSTNSDPIKDRRGCYKRGMPVIVMPDNHPWGKEEGLPHFVVIKVPGVSVEKLSKYIEHEREETADNEGRFAIYRRRLWKFRFDDMPTAALRKLRDDGEMTIKVGDYSGSYDYTWTRVRAYLRNLKTNLDEAGNL